MTYTIQEAADKMGLTAYTLRYYDNHGMLPYVKRDENNNRIFDEVDLEWIHIIICMRKTGMPLKKIQHYLQLVVQGEQTVPERYQIMLEQQQRTLAEINELNQHLMTINKKVSHYADILINQKPDTYVPSNISSLKSTDHQQTAN
jgi:DNA-binding transcriptional MerR regulator